MKCIKMKRFNGNRVPCGQCAFCLTNRRSEWMFRIHHEMRLQDHPGWFITLTYDEKHVKRAANGRLSLRFRDVQLYLKRIRKAKYYAKYICVGEYGTKTLRPHYHMLLWTDAPTDFLQSNWKSSKDNTPMGTLHFGKLQMASAMYTLKYIIQPKQREIDGVEKTRAQFSRGLGLGYLTTDVYYWHTDDYKNPRFYSYIDGRKVALPKYYKNKIFTPEQTRLEAVRQSFKAVKEKRELYDRLRRKGVKKIRTMLRENRLTQARRIIAKTKFNLSL